jgi:glucokinase
MASYGLLADIGATNARFALASPDGIEEERVLKCADHPGIVEAALAYLDIVRPEQKPKAASMAIAGPVTGDWFEMTNHPWHFSIDGARQILGLDIFHLMNDFKAVALAVPHLQGKDLHKIGSGAALPCAPIGVIGPGTGLGVASLVHDGAAYNAIPGEGGHVTMPARTLREFDLFRVLIDMKYSHISAERVCSGKGLVNVYNALRILDDRKDLADRTPEEIGAAAFDGSCALCFEATQLMTAFLGRVAGNLALTLGTNGGIYIAGGIANRWGAHFDEGLFRTEFEEKGRFRDYMSAIPTWLIKHDFPAFVGLYADLVRS